MDVINKELFVEVLNDIKKCDDYESSLNKNLHEHGVDGYLFQPNCIDSAIKLLHEIFGDADTGDIIAYFCFDLEHGRKWKEGTITEKDGTDIDISTPDKLYDYLISQME